VTPAALADMVRTVAHDLLADRGLDTSMLPAAVTVARPRNPEHGDYATAIALQTGGVASREFAGWLAEALRGAEGLRSAEVAGPGFLNLRLATGAQARIVDEVLTAGESYGTAGMPAGIDPQHVAARTRTGTMVAMTDLVETLGADAARYAALRCSPGMPVDVERWSRRTDGNPLFVVQYAHSRLAALDRNAAELGVTAEGADVSLLGHEREGALIATLAEFGRIVTQAAQRGEPHRIARYLEQLAGTFHEFSDTCRVLPMGDEEPGPRHGARLALCRATRQVLANGLRLLGVTAPERM
jgi:arginyl-tRNA synthetase